MVCDHDRVGSPCQMGDYTFAVRISNGYAEVFCGFNASVVECAQGSCPSSARCVPDDDAFDGDFDCTCVNEDGATARHILVNTTCKVSTPTSRMAQVESIKDVTTQKCFGSRGQNSTAIIVGVTSAGIIVVVGVGMYMTERNRRRKATRLQRRLRRAEEQLRRDLNLDPASSFGPDALPDDIGMYVHVTRENLSKEQDNVQDLIDQVHRFLRALPHWTAYNLRIRSVSMSQSRERILVVLTPKIVTYSVRRWQTPRDKNTLARDVDTFLKKHLNSVYFIGDSTMMYATSAQQVEQARVPKIWGIDQVEWLGSNHTKSELNDVDEGINRDGEIDRSFRTCKARLTMNVPKRLERGGKLAPLLVAAKLSDVSPTSASYSTCCDQLVSEATLLASLDHPSIIPIIGIVESHAPPITARFVPFYENGTLIKFLRKHNANISVTQKLTFCIQIGRGVEYLNRCSIVHTGLSVYTIFLDSRSCCVIGNIGSHFKQGSKSKKKVHKLPIESYAPELLKIGTNMCTAKSTVWAYGIAMHIILSDGQRPYDVEVREPVPGASERTPQYHMQDEQIKQHVIHEGIPLQGKRCDAKIYNQLLTPCWRYLPYLRSTIPEILDTLVRFGGIDEFRDAVPKTMAADLTQELNDKPSASSSPSCWSRMLPAGIHTPVFQKEPLEVLLRAPSLAYLLGEFYENLEIKVSEAMQNPKENNVPASVEETTMRQVVSVCFNSILCRRDHATASCKHRSSSALRRECAGYTFGVAAQKYRCTILTCRERERVCVCFFSVASIIHIVFESRWGYPQEDLVVVHWLTWCTTTCGTLCVERPLCERHNT
eukprot:m.1365806 g.1365806  ORF g.1365806 m.1365806 type:complete len:826 (+) comp24948_c0_seq3:123-2600(+)